MPELILTQLTQQSWLTRRDFSALTELLSIDISNRSYYICNHIRNQKNEQSRKATRNGAGKGPELHSDDSGDTDDAEQGYLYS